MLSVVGAEAVEKAISIIKGSSSSEQATDIGRWTLFGRRRRLLKF
jgi:hypothetical protein